MAFLRTSATASINEFRSAGVSILRPLMMSVSFSIFSKPWMLSTEMFQ